MAAARENELGRCRCPVCDSTRARLRLSAKQLTYVVCDACNVQVFARSDRSDERLRRLLLEPGATPDPAPAPEPAPIAATPAPAVPKPAAEPLPNPAPTPAPVETPTRRRMSWGAFPDLT